MSEKKVSNKEKANEILLIVLRMQAKRDAQYEAPEPEKLERVPRFARKV